MTINLYCQDWLDDPQPIINLDDVLAEEPEISQAIADYQELNIP